jgi:CDP-diacylglycerol pyrophosphatase
VKHVFPLPNLFFKIFSTRCLYDKSGTREASPFFIVQSAAGSAALNENPSSLFRILFPGAADEQ